MQMQLVRQFMTESVLMNLLALLVALLIVMLVQPLYNQLLGIELSPKWLFRKVLYGYTIPFGLGALFIAGTLLSGFYPAFVLSSWKPITVLKGRLSFKGKGSLLRKGLVVGQFAITICLLVGCIVVYRQIVFMNNRNLGYNMDQVLVVKPPFRNTGSDSTWFSRMHSFKNEVARMNGVAGVTGSDRLPGRSLARAFNVRIPGDSTDNRYTVRTWNVHPDFVQLYQMKIVAGRSFNESDHHCNAQLLHTLLINESAAKLFGFHSPEEAVGKKVTAFNREWDIVGVTADFHQKSVKQRIEPTLLIPAETFNSSFSIKVTPGQVQQVIAGVHAKFDYFFPGDLFEYYFLDEKFNEQYRYDRMFGKVFGFFAGLAIFIACLGLFGLSLYTISQRTKEIGVRKVLGASVQHIVVLLSKDFIRLVLIAGLIAFPVAGVVMKNWLDDFAYRTELSWWIFVAAGVLAACIAWATVAVHAVRSALAKPVDVLRNE